MASFKRVRQVKMTTEALLGIDLEESSSDSDFRIEDLESNDGEGSEGSSTSSSSSSVGNDDDAQPAESSNEQSEDSTNELKRLLTNTEEGDEGVGVLNGTNGDEIEAKLKQLNIEISKLPKEPLRPICCVCLGDRSDDSNEIIECDGCGISVHECCYGVSDNISISSTNSTCSTEPWFCEACRAGISEPVCELCPNRGGIFKETDVGKWVHLICALYIPGVAFGEVDQLSSVTLFEMPYNRWGAKKCTLCDNSLNARSGVCIGCDAGMCKTFFHVTCAQAAGFLIEAHHEDAAAADPFYAHCKVHSEKEMIKKRKRNYQTLRLNMFQKEKDEQILKLDDPSPAQVRIHRKLQKYRNKYLQQKESKPVPWIPTQKMSRLLTTSATACKRMLAKAENLTLDVKLLERQERQIAAVTDIRKKWHIQPAFNVEFVAYYLDRISRTTEIKQQVRNMVESNTSLSNEQELLRERYDKALEKSKTLKLKNEMLCSKINELHKCITLLCPSKHLPTTENIACPQPETTKATTPPQRPISVPTAAALKMGVGFPLSHLGPPGSKVNSTRMLSTHARNSPNTGSNSSNSVTPTLGLHACGICKRCNDQHLLAACDTCKLYYHLGCLNPPLSRHPKKSKQYGWECSECCEKSNDSDVLIDLPPSSRKSRARIIKDDFYLFPDNLEPSPEPATMKRRINDSISDTSPVALSKSSDKGVELLLNADFNTDAKHRKLLESSSASCKSKSSVSPNLKDMPQSTPVKNATAIVDIELNANCLKIADAKCATEITESNIQDAILSKQARKQKRKDKHKSKHNLSEDNEKAHKRKHKKKQHHLKEIDAASIPKIKIKIKTLPLPGEDTPEASFYYVSADAVRSAEECSRSPSIETVEELIVPDAIDDLNLSVSAVTPTSASAALVISQTNKKLYNKRGRAGRKKFSRKLNARKIAIGRPKLSAQTNPNIEIMCCVCQVSGKAATVVTCDVCRKHYHFACLEPPLKKTPKIRGYSWHCADCDPTDEDKK